MAPNAAAIAAAAAARAAARCRIARGQGIQKLRQTAARREGAAAIRFSSTSSGRKFS